MGGLRLVEPGRKQTPSGVSCKTGAWKVLEPLRNDLIALASRGLETSAIDDRHVAAAVGNESRFLQHSGRDRNTGPPHPEHRGKELLRERKRIRVYPIVGTKNPPRREFTQR